MYRALVGGGEGGTLIFDTVHMHDHLFQTYPKQVFVHLSAKLYPKQFFTWFVVKKNTLNKFWTKILPQTSFSLK